MNLTSNPAFLSMELDITVPNFSFNQNVQENKLNRQLEREGCYLLN